MKLNNPLSVRPLQRAADAGGTPVSRYPALHIARSIVVFIIAVVPLVGCMTSPPAPTDSYYRLTPEQLGAPKELVLPISLQVRRFTADGLLRERALLYSDDHGHRVLKQHNYHFWTDAPARLFTDYWRARLGDQRAALARTSGAGRYALHGRVRRMERLVDKDGVEIALGIELWVVDNISGIDIIRRRYDVIERTDSGQVVDSVKAYEVALQIVSAQFVTDLAERSSLIENATSRATAQSKPIFTARPAYEGTP